MRKVSRSTYELDLSKSEFPRIHPEFHVALLWRKEEAPVELSGRLSLFDKKAAVLPAQVEVAPAPEEEVIVPVEKEWLIESVLFKQKNRSIGLNGSVVMM